MQSLVVCTVLAAAAAVSSATLLHGNPLSYSAGYAAGYSLPLSYATPVAVAAPLRYAAVAAPAVAVAPAVVGAVTRSQSHAQDELGQYKFNYNTGNQARTEVKTADGVVRGSYSYIDGNGVTQKVNYIADALGFRTVGTNLPVAAY